MEKVVVDTSVAVKWYVEERGTALALQLLNDYQEGKVEITAPSIISLELANALFFGAGFKEKNLHNSLEAFSSLNFDLVPLSDEFILGAAKYMEEFKIAIYDASFIFLAEQENIPLITADKKHHKTKFFKLIRYL